MKKEIFENKKNPDEVDIRWKGTRGYAFLDKETGEIGLIRCPKCGMENHAMNVMSGICTWCGFDANKNSDQEEPDDKVDVSDCCGAPVFDQDICSECKEHTDIIKQN